MKARVLTGFCIFLALVAMVASRLLTPYIFDVCFVCISACASFEIANCLNERDKDTFVYASLVYPALIYGVFLVAYLKNLSWWWILIFELWLFIFAFIVLFVISIFQKRKIGSVLWTLFSFIYPGYLLMFFY